MNPKLRLAIICPPTEEGYDVGFYTIDGFYNIRINSGSLQQFLLLIREFNGTRSIEDIAEITATSSSDAARMLSNLIDNKIAVDTSIALSNIFPTEHFLSKFDNLKRMLRYDMARHPLFEALFQNEHKKTILSAIFIEYFALIKSAEKHISRAIANSPAVYRSYLELYREEEQHHYKDIEPKLLRLLPTGCAIDDIEILASSEAIMLKTEQLATQSTLGYVAACDLTELDHFVSQDEKLDILGTDLIGTDHERVMSAFFNHANEDLQHSHSSLLRSCLSKHHTFPARTSQRLFATCTT